MNKKLNAKQLRNLDEAPMVEGIRRNPFYLIIDNVYDTYNIGGLFRLADALAMEKVYLCGISETPPNSRIKKASIGTYKVVPWKYCKSTLEAISDLRKKQPKIQVLSLELDEKALPYDEYDYKYPLALVVGHETKGVSKEVLKASDDIITLPMFGYNISLNVIVSAAIVAYHANDLILK